MDALAATIPEEVYRWDGVALGWHELGREVMPVRGFSEKIINGHFEGRLAWLEHATWAREDRDTIGEQWNSAVTELREMRRTRAYAYRDAGLPYTPSDEDEYWAPYLDRIGSIEAEIAETPAITQAGAALKLMVLLAFERIQQHRTDIVIAGKDFDLHLALSAALDLERLAEGDAS